MPRSNVPLPIKPGQRVLVEMPWSEVCMHMRIAGKPMVIEVIPSKSWGHTVQIYTREGREFSAPVLTGEAGVYGYGDNMYVYPWLNNAENEGV